MLCLIKTVFFVLQEDDIQFLYNENTAKQSDNIMDKWIQSFTQSLIQFFKAEMDGETDLNSTSVTGHVKLRLLANLFSIIHFLELSVVITCLLAAVK